MKYCICIRGMHYSHKHIIIDYKKSSDNYKSKIFQPLIDDGHEIFIFLLTYESPVLNQLIDEYNPVLTHIIPLSEIDNVDTWTRQKHWHLKSINMIQQYENDNSMQFDYIMNIRFDFLYTNILSNINNDKINIIFKHHSGNCDDNFFFFPKKLLPIFEHAVKEIIKNGNITHEINHYMNEKNNVNYISDYINYGYFMNAPRKHNR